MAAITEYVEIPVSPLVLLDLYSFASALLLRGLRRRAVAVDNSPAHGHCDWGCARVVTPTCCPHMSFMFHIFQDRRCSHLVRHMFPCCWFLMGYTRCVSNKLCHPRTAGRILPLHSALLLRGEQTFQKTFQIRPICAAFAGRHGVSSHQTVRRPLLKSRGHDITPVSGDFFRYLEGHFVGLHPASSWLGLVLLGPCLMPWGS